MSAPAVRGCASRRGQRDRFAIVDVSRDNHRVHVRRPADCRRVSELRRDEPHRKRHVSLRVGRGTWRPQLGEHRCGAQRSAPRAKILRAVPTDAPLEVCIHVSRSDRSPVFFVAVAEERRPGSPKLPCDKPHQLTIRDDLPLSNAAFTAILEPRHAAGEIDVRFPQRGDTERAILSRVPLSADPAERLTDESQYGRRNHVGTQCRDRRRRMCVGLDRFPDAWQLLGELSDSMIFAKLAPLDRALVVAVLLSSARVEAPGLNGRSRRSSDVNVAPRRRNSQRDESRDCPPIGNDMPARIDVAKAGRLRTDSPNPSSHSTEKRKTHTRAGIAPNSRARYAARRAALPL